MPTLVYYYLPIDDGVVDALGILPGLLEGGGGPHSLWIKDQDVGREACVQRPAVDQTQHCAHTADAQERQLSASSWYSPRGAVLCIQGRGGASVNLGSFRHGLLPPLWLFLRLQRGYQLAGWIGLDAHLGTTTRSVSLRLECRQSGHGRSPRGSRMRHRRRLPPCQLGLQ